MTPDEDRERELLSRVAAGKVSHDERDELIERMRVVAEDEALSRADRVGAIVLRAALIARSVPHGRP
jgi:hypothetical protein